MESRNLEEQYTEIVAKVAASPGYEQVRRSLDELAKHKQASEPRPRTVVVSTVGAGR